MNTVILSPTIANLGFLSQELSQGTVVAIPTETVYGLAAHAYDSQAIKQIFEIKERPMGNPLILHYPSIQAMEKDVFFPESAALLAQAFWPGPLTLVLEKRPDSLVSPLASAGLNTLAVRIPSCLLTVALLEDTGFPLAAPSANRSGSLSPVSAQQVLDSLQGRLGWILDGGRCLHGLESTIIDLSTGLPTLLRAGSIPRHAIQAVLSQASLSLHGPVQETKQAPITKAPGTHFPHYAPRIPLRLSMENPGPAEALLIFGQTPYPAGYRYIFNLSPSGDLAEAAHYFFHYLHILGDLPITRISVGPIPTEGLGEALNDKLMRAAANFSSTIGLG